MYARVESFYDKNRVKLADAIPLNTPFSLNVEPTSACNLRCKYCGHSSEEFMKDFHHEAKTMEKELFLNLVLQTTEFPGKFKVVQLAGYGEPLLHPNIVEFVCALRQADIAERVQILTNGTRLTHALSEGLVEAGLDRVLISVNGLSDADYECNTGRKIDFDDYLSNIKYLFSIRNQLKIDLKIVDACLKDDQERERFFSIFGDFCDRISVENTHILIHNTKSYGSLSDRETALWKFDELKGTYPHICPLPFYGVSVRANGDISMCNCLGLQLTKEGLNIQKVSLKDAWDGDWRKEVLLKILREDYSGSTQICGKCIRKMAFGFPEDLLDADRDRLIQRLSAL